MIIKRTYSSIQKKGDIKNISFHVLFFCYNNTKYIGYFSVL